jgi:hypothetical protein
MRKYSGGKFWADFSEHRLDALARMVFRDLRNEGYPFVSYPWRKKAADFLGVIKSGSVSPMVVNGVVKQSMTGLKALWPYFPHHLRVKCGGKMSPMEAFLDDAKLKRAISHRLNHGTYLTENGIRKSLKVVSNVQSVSNFRPTAAKAIYDHFGGGVVWDMSAGYGGRMMGAMASSVVSRYIACEPEQATYNGLCAMVYDFRNLHCTDIHLHQSGCELFIPREPVDICFTSPPYFDHEKYGTGPEQSYRKFQAPQDWFDGFLMATVGNCVKCLKPGGHLILNIDSVPTFPTLREDFLSAMSEHPAFSEKPTLRLALSRMPHPGKAATAVDGLQEEARREQTMKYEPVFVYEKIKDSC